MILKGKVHCFGDDVDTDAIIPARHMTTSEPDELAEHCMEDAEPEFVRKVNRGDLIVAGKNFGCGSSREHAPIAIQAAGVSCVIAGSFARIFYRNAINIGLPILECEKAVREVQSGDELEVDPVAGSIRNLTRNQEYQAIPFPPFMQNIIEKGGLINYVKERMKQQCQE
ncbi:MAG: 3-isopropylmalate dehydratase small subunit [Syntrophomonadaceae bacterium]|nr:3-isopropylmalate dehydratase small subunit [Syntrophomonadaceae bacterium]